MAGTTGDGDALSSTLLRFLNCATSFEYDEDISAGNDHGYARSSTLLRFLNGTTSFYMTRISPQEMAMGMPVTSTIFFRTNFSDKKSHLFIACIDRSVYTVHTEKCQHIKQTACAKFLRSLGLGRIHFGSVCMRKDCSLQQKSCPFFVIDGCPRPRVPGHMPRRSFSY